MVSAALPDDDDDYNCYLKTAGQVFLPSACYLPCFLNWLACIAVSLSPNLLCGK